VTAIFDETKQAEIVFSVNIVRQNYNEESFEDLTNPSSTQTLRFLFLGKIMRLA